MAIVPDEYQQRRVLRRLAKEFPGLVEVSLFADIDTPESHRVLFYLAEKGFVEPGQISDRPGRSREMLEARITAKGLDWLEKGGESQALRGEMTIGESEALRQFLVQSLNASSLSEEVKVTAKNRLLGFSAEDLKALHLRLLQALAQRPEVIAEVLISKGIPT